ncbi:MAG TPA: 4Fe-4S dicluster domain-containing protein [Pseudobacteroides sp.]|uniref:4Fe-4S binding protein n=1 Tax=Pseudobacteroides sp. TaxID=1968840 RepID=UPI002F934994
MFDMLGSIIKNLTSKPATRKYPFEKRQAFKDSRGQISGIEIDQCIFCGICQRKCPADALAVSKADKSWEIDQFRCIICGVCVEVCPKKCINMEDEYKTSAYKKEKYKAVQKAAPQPPAPKEGQ